jgi:sec-independent protein translocase protein TatA
LPDVDITSARDRVATLQLDSNLGAPVPNIGLPELAIVLVILLVIFGPKKLPGLGRSLGTGMREFKDSITGKDDDKRSIAASDDDDDEPTKPEQHDDSISRNRG